LEFFFILVLGHIGLVRDNKHYACAKICCEVVERIVDLNLSTAKKQLILAVKRKVINNDQKYDPLDQYFVIPFITVCLFHLWIRFLFNDELTDLAGCLATNSIVDAVYNKPELV
jgi:hypothetical protein